jgi:hypothetical protein
MTEFCRYMIYRWRYWREGRVTMNGALTFEQWRAYWAVRKGTR